MSTFSNQFKYIVLHYFVSMTRQLDLQTASYQSKSLIVAITEW